MGEGTDVKLLETGWILTPPGYLSYGCWRTELRMQGVSHPSCSRHFVAEPFYEIDQAKNQPPKNYTVFEYSYASGDLKEKNLLSIIDNSDGKGEKNAEKRAENFAKKEVKALTARSPIQQHPYLGEMVLQDGTYILKRHDI